MDETPPTEPSGTYEPPKNMTSVVISRAKFDAVPRKRAWYIGLYTLSFLLWAYMAIGMVRFEATQLEEADSTTETIENLLAEPTAIDPADWPRSIQIVRMLIPVVLVLFYVPFVSVLRTMGYPWVGVLALCAFAFAPIPGLLVVAFIDTRIAKTWNSADLDSPPPTHDSA